MESPRRTCGLCEKSFKDRTYHEHIKDSHLGLECYYPESTLILHKEDDTKMIEELLQMNDRAGEGNGDGDNKYTCYWPHCRAGSGLAHHYASRKTLERHLRTEQKKEKVQRDAARANALPAGIQAPQSTSQNQNVQQAAVQMASGTIQQKLSALGQDIAATQQPLLYQAPAFVGQHNHGMAWPGPANALPPPAHFLQLSAEGVPQYPMPPASPFSTAAQQVAGAVEPTLALRVQLLIVRAGIDAEIESARQNQEQGSQAAMNARNLARQAQVEAENAVCFAQQQEAFLGNVSQALGRILAALPGDQSQAPVHEGQDHEGSGQDGTMSDN